MQAHESSSGARKQGLLRQALGQKTPPERAAFLDGACGGDAALRVEIETWLAIYDGGEPERRLQPVAALRMEAGLTGHEGGERGPGPNAEAGNAPPGEGATEVTPTLLDETPLTEGPGTVIGRYKLLEQIGEGGFGVVYVAEQQEPVRRPVALKIIKLGMDTRQVVARFEAERQALALMDHPNIAKVFDAGATDGGRPFFVMELVKGIPITKYCDQEKLGTSDRLKLFIAVCQAIQHAHQKGIIHRDIKPSNILVALQEGRPVPKVIDFGIAKATQQRLTEKTLHTLLQQFIGTPAYMSPEQAEMSGLDIDTRSDIYSLGVLLYELLVSKTPFDSKELLAAGLDEIRRTIREKEPPRPSTRLTQELSAVAASRSRFGIGTDSAGEDGGALPGRRYEELRALIHLLRGDLDWIVMKCLEKDRTRRYETANGLARDIERHLNNEPVVARPPSTAYRLQKAWRRNKLALTAAAVMAMSLVVGIGVSSWQAFEASTARNTEKQQRQRAERREAEARQNLYAAHMNLALQAVEEQNIGYALSLLDLHRPQPGQPDLRGWEWRYLWKLCRSDELVRLGSHSNVVLDAVFSPREDVLATCSADQTVKLWDMTAQRETAVLRHDGSVVAAAFSADGNALATACADGNLRVWDVATRRELRRVAVANIPEHAIWAFSPGGEMLALSGGTGTVYLWDVRSGNQGGCPRGRADPRVPGLFPEWQNTRRWSCHVSR